MVRSAARAADATIIDDPVGTNDIQYPRCTGFLYEYQYGFEVHTNCHDILAEAIREYGLTPDDVHDSFNFWMHTGVADDHMFIKRLMARKGDYVELIAQMDVLAVPNVCGADIFSTSNFELKPLLVQVFEGTEEQHEHWLEPAERRYRNQRTVDAFKVKQIRVERELTRDESYTPEFSSYPIVTHGIEVELDDRDVAAVEALRGRFGDTDGEIVRHAFFSWWIEAYMQGPKHLQAGD